MAKVRLYYFQIWHGESKVEIKTDDWNKVIVFIKLNKKGLTGFNQGYRLVPENKLQHCIDNVSIKDLMTLKKEEEKE